MARADYFERAIQAASHILGGLDQNSFLEKVDSHRVAIAFDASVRGAEASATTDLLIRLIARFYPSITLTPLQEGCDDVLSDFKKLARQVNPKIAIARKLQNAKDVIVVGNTPVPERTGPLPIYIGSDGWIARLSRGGPIGSGGSHNPIGAGIAACLAAANIFRGLFTNASVDDELTLSALDLDPTNKLPPNPSIDGLDLEQVFLVGAGAIGNGFLWALSRSSLSGRLTVIEHDHVDLGNMQRYVLTLRKHENKSKTELVEDLFQGHPGISVSAVPKKWEDFVGSLPEDQWLFERVVVALDSAEDRIGVQASLPRWVVNGWTQQGEIGVSRHNFIGEEACMACLYMPQGEAPHEDLLITNALGFPQESLSRLLKYFPILSTKQRV